ncbi:amidase [Rubrimonas cliftonensis]|uniref:Aspartyl-tRNA(Asn)/glutamyl-tRNA(Gln) amidotransferase subunit A n=1 Tax=Rubrimonas cliftonensis TaxID=89524 RepID=A0A1H4ATX3_9RHOB|nr:amidase [Rubrimonas cliftonensis]SEA39359.1 aspartyl-tRNA(Asn)/glutamyl-tRNA(Gln) amidotransferase subunit A [Rubrimonas cliftonensis]
MIGSNAFPTIAEASRAIEAGTLSPVALTEFILDRIAALDGRLNAYLTVTADAARAEARDAEAEIRAGRRRGPLHGVPIAFKDIFETAGVPTTCQSRALAGHVPARDATSVAKVRAAGAVGLGKLTTHEFAFGGPSFDILGQPARNPWNTAHFTGGSSSGTGAAVTAGLALGGFGSDTGGSIRLPAAYFGLVGLKPTYGRISRAGVFPLAFSLDHAGPMAWTAEDCAIMLEAMAGHDPADPASADVPAPPYAAMLDRDLTGLRIGVIRHFWEEAEAEPETVAALEAALKVFEGLGAKLVEVRLSPLSDWCATCSLILLSEAFAVHEEWLRGSPEIYGEFMRMRLFLAGAITAADYVQALRRRRELCAEFAAAFADVDVMFTATAAGPAPRIEEMGAFYTFARPLLTMPFNVTGSPALATRAGFSSEGLPLSLSLIGKPFDEATVLAAAHAYEKATEWAARRPSLEAVDAAA